MNCQTEQITLQVDQLMGGGFAVSAVVGNSVLAYYGPELVKLILVKVAEKAADEFMRLHGAEVLEKMSPDAVAGSLSLQATEKVASAIDGVRQAIKNRPAPETHVHVRNFNSIF